MQTKPKVNLDLHVWLVYLWLVCRYVLGRGFKKEKCARASQALHSELVILQSQWSIDFRFIYLLIFFCNFYNKLGVKVI